MISAMSSGFNANSLFLSSKAGVPETDASTNEGKTQGMSRAIQRQVALSAETTPVVEELPKVDCVGPAQEMARNQALQRGNYCEQAIAAKLLDQNSDFAPGPKPTNRLIAELNYLKAVNLIS
jgi:hypothetical protein